MDLIHDTFCDDDTPLDADIYTMQDENNEKHDRVQHDIYVHLSTQSVQTAGLRGMLGLWGKDLSSCVVNLSALKANKLVDL